MLTLHETFDHWSVAVFTVTINFIYSHFWFCFKQDVFCTEMNLLASFLSPLHDNGSPFISEQYLFFLFNSNIPRQARRQHLKSISFNFKQFYLQGSQLQKSIQAYNLRPYMSHRPHMSRPCMSHYVTNTGCVPEKASHFWIRVTENILSLKIQIIHFWKNEICSYLAG